MNYMPKLDRRSFLAGSATVGLSLGFHVPFMSSTSAQGAPEINAWVVIKPDETVVIRIARSEMGQGTLTGLAQMVAEELECDWSKVTTEYPTPGESVARKNPWGDFGTGGSRGIRTSQDYVRKGGAAARMMLIQAAANEWKVPASECTAANGVITHKASNCSTTYGKVAAAAALIEPPKGSAAQGSEGLEGHRQERQAARHRRQDGREDDVRRRREATRHAQRGDQGLPGVWRQGQELRRHKGRVDEGRQESGAGRRQRCGRRCRYVVAREDWHSTRCRSFGTQAKMLRYRVN